MSRRLDRVLASRIGPWLMRPYRLWRVGKHFWRAARPVPRWILRSREWTNFTYSYAELGDTAASQFVALVTGVDVARIESFGRELDSDGELKQWLSNRVANSPYRHTADTEIHFGRRRLYYLIVRASRPRVVVEAGTDKGMGACLIAAALQRNAREGFPGRLHAVDFGPDRGQLLGDRFSEVAELSIGDSVGFLQDLDRPIDFFVHDTGSDEDHEIPQYRALEARLSDSAITLSTWYTPPFVEFARRNGRRFLVFTEAPRDHWFPGDTLVASFRPASPAGPNILGQP